ncbi:hypothetical protein ACWGOQ_0012685 [Aquimarina sp. M1]
MTYNNYIDHLEAFNKQLKELGASISQSREEYLESVNLYQSNLKSFLDDNAKSTFDNQCRFLIEINKDKLSILETQERNLLTEKQDLTLTYQIISSKESTRQQRWLTGAIIFIGLISLLKAFKWI